jgi:RHS repeat-associated protein
VVSGTATIVWVHANHLGVPLTTTDATGTELAPSNAYTALGFPGQMKTLPDLWYNRHRDYDPGTGRYVQADPIGLAGGENPYLYAKANPLRYVDPSGKNPALVVIGVCARFPVQCAAVAGAIGGAIVTALRPRMGPAKGPKDWTKIEDYTCTDNDDDCEEEWADAYAICKAELAKPYPNRRMTGGYKDVHNCARGLVSQRCGGNRITLVIPTSDRTALARKEEDLEYIQNFETHQSKDA